MLFLDILDGLAVFVWKKLETWWVAHWLPSQIRVPLVVTNVSQLQETIIQVISGRNTTCEHELNIFIYDQKL